MVILPNDPLSEYFRNSSLKESEMYTNFITWKFIMLKESALTRFVKIKDSSYILAVELYSDYGILILIKVMYLMDIILIYSKLSILSK